MKALQFPKVGEARVIDVPVPEISGDEVLLHVRAAGVCYSDIMAFKGLHPYRVPPTITGHEVAGEVVAVGESVRSLAIGDRVAVEPHIGCGTCIYCRRGAYNVCVEKGLIGVGTWIGAFAEYMVARESMCFPIPDSMSWDVAAAIEPFAVGLHAAKIAGVALGQTAAVLGCGTIGMVTLMSLKLRGVDTLIVSEPSAAKREMASRLGADVVFDPRDTDPVSEVLSRTGGMGVDTVFVTVSVPAVLKQAFLMCKRQGSVIIVAVFPGDTPVEIWQIQNYERRVLGTNMYTGEDYLSTITHIRKGNLDLSPLITQRVHVTDAPDIIRKLAAGERPDDIKTIISFE